MRCVLSKSVGSLSHAANPSSRSPVPPRAWPVRNRGSQHIPTRRLERHVRTHANPFDSLKNMLGGMGQPSDAEDEEGASMVRIDSETKGITGEDAFGPFAILAVGFMADEFDAVKQLMVEIEADELQLIPCTKAMLSGTLQQALESGSTSYEQPALGMRRAVFLSGMYGSEIVEMVSAFRESGMPPCVFAAAVPNNYGRTVQSLIEEVYADHNAMMKRRAEAEAQSEGSGESQ